MTFFTKEQLAMVIQAWGVNASIPRKGTDTVISWPKHCSPNVARISWTDKKGTYGERLYCVQYGN